MKKRLCPILMGLCGLLAFTLSARQASAQTPEVNAKPPLYSYVSNWQFPRSSWPALAKSHSTIGSILDKAVADGTIIGYGTDKNIVLQPDALTHDTWWSSMSLAGLVRVQEQIAATAGNTNPVLYSATKHWDSIYVSRYYNWNSGYYYDACTHVSVYKFKEGAPEGALNTLAQNLIVPVLEKQLANGVILGYQIDTLAIHTEAPGTFWVVYITLSPEGLDTVEEALHDSPEVLEAFADMTDNTSRRDELMKSDAIYK